MKKFFTLLLGAETWQEVRRKGLRLALLVPAVRWMDWVAVGVTGSLVAFLKWKEFSSPEIFFVLWLANIAYSGAIVFANDYIGTDMLLMEALRRMIDALIAKSRIVGYMVEAVVVVRLVVWDGPDNFILFFRQRFTTSSQRLIAFVIASAIQMAIWTAIYTAGYDTLIHGG